MTEQHPITQPPPQDKFNRWEDDILNARENVDVVLDCTWKDGYRAGADAELRASCEWLSKYRTPILAADLWFIRRPKPPSLKEQALAALAELAAECYGNTDQADTIRRALEALPE
jgi:hypothetical protein